MISSTLYCISAVGSSKHWVQDSTSGGWSALWQEDGHYPKHRWKSYTEWADAMNFLSILCFPPPFLCLPLSLSLSLSLPSPPSLFPSFSPYTHSRMHTHVCKGSGDETIIPGLLMLSLPLPLLKLSWQLSLVNPTRSLLQWLGEDWSGWSNSHNHEQRLWNSRGYSRRLQTRYHNNYTCSG